MKIKGLVVAVLVAGASLTVCAEAGAATLACSERKAIQPVTLEDPGRWTYTYHLSWCGDGGKISDVEVVVIPEVHDSACNWGGRVEEAVNPLGDSKTGAWSAFDMSKFSCGTDKPVGVNPWVKITFEPSGDYEDDGGIAPES